MNKWFKNLWLLMVFSTHVWADEPYKMKMPNQPRVTIEAAQATHLLDTADYKIVVNELNTLSNNYWFSYQGKQLVPQCVLKVQDPTNPSFVTMVFSFFNDNQGMIYVESPINGAAGGVATGILPQNIPNISRICQIYWQPVIKN